MRKRLSMLLLVLAVVFIMSSFIVFAGNGQGGAMLISQGDGKGDTLRDQTKNKDQDQLRDGSCQSSLITTEKGLVITKDQDRTKDKDQDQQRDQLRDGSCQS